MARSGTGARWLVTLASLLASAGCDDADPRETPAPSSCFAPDKNLDTAYDDGAVGCACSAKDEDQCIDGVALVCERGQWQAVEDGPCWPDAGPGEACGDTLCSQYGTCVTFADGHQACVSTLIDSGVPRIEAGASVQASGEKCGSDRCTEFAYCTQDAGCRAKRNPGEACSEARMCMSGKCSAGSCEYDDRNCTGTWDTSQDFAQVICRQRDCHVCVQSVDERGQPIVFGAIEPASCVCPGPRWVSASR